MLVVNFNAYLPSINSNIKTTNSCSKVRPLKNNSQFLRPWLYFQITIYLLQRKNKVMKQLKDAKSFERIKFQKNIFLHLFKHKNKLKKIYNVQITF
jgi:hypothetical protein